MGQFLCLVSISTLILGILIFGEDRVSNMKNMLNISLGEAKRREEEGKKEKGEENENRAKTERLRLPSHR